MKKYFISALTLFSTITTSAQDETSESTTTTETSTNTALSEAASFVESPVFLWGIGIVVVIILGYLLWKKR